MREQFGRQAKKLSGAYNTALWAMERDFKEVNQDVSVRIHRLRREVEKQIPAIAHAMAATLGPILLCLTRREEKRLASGRTYHPPNLYRTS